MCAMKLINNTVKRLFAVNFKHFKPAYLEHYYIHCMSVLVSMKKKNYIQVIFKKKK